MCTAVQAAYTGEGSRKRSEVGPNARQCGAAERTSGSRNWLQSRSRNIRWLWGTPTSTARSRSLDSWATSGGGRSGARREACGACFGGVSSCQLKSLPGGPSTCEGVVLATFAGWVYSSAGVEGVLWTVCSHEAEPGGGMCEPMPQGKAGPMLRAYMRADVNRRPPRMAGCL